MDPSPLPSLVLVTGANGYIGASLVQSLLAQGYKVRGTVRDASNERKTGPLFSMENAATNLELVSMDLSEPSETFLEIFKDVEWVFHVASPVTLEAEEAENQEQKDTIIQSARDGTLAMLRASSDTSSVQRFVLTSSVAAIGEGHMDYGSRPLAEDNWSNMAGSNISAYGKSKTLEERAAWEFVEASNPEFSLSVINPSIVFGPLPTPETQSSTVIISSLLQAQDFGIISSLLQLRDLGTIDLFTCIADIRDVVEAHIQAAKRPEAAGKREMFLPDVAKILKKEFGPMGYSIQDYPMPSSLAWFYSLVDADLAALYPILGKEYHLCNIRSKSVLQLEYTPAEKTILDCAYSLIEHGIVEKKSGYVSRST
ncbi:MAG: hypothetical protein SGARI_002830 [Bacillariaceae sp.]